MTKKLATLTSEQEKQLKQFCKEQLNEILYTVKTVQYEDIKDDIDWLYNFSGIKQKPFILIFDSWTEAQYAANYCAVLNLIVSGELKPEKLRNQVSNQVWNQVWNQGLVFFYNYRGLFWEAWWLNHIEFFRQIGIVKDENFVRWRSFLYKGIFNIMFLDNFTIITRTPKKVKLNERGMHSLTGPAFEWQNNEYYYCIDGVFFSKSLWQKIKDRSLSVEEILKIENQEQRMIALKYYGPENLLKDCNARLIDSSKRGNELYEITSLIPGRELKLLKYFYIDKIGQRKDYVDWVLDKFDKADEAMAWKHNLTPKLYAMLAKEA